MSSSSEQFEKWRKDQIASLIRTGHVEAAKAFEQLGSIHWMAWQSSRAAQNAEFAQLKRYSAEQARKIEALTETHVLYSWLRKKCDEPSNNVVAVHMNIGHDWTPVQDLDRDLRTMIDQEEP